MHCAIVCDPIPLSRSLGLVFSAARRDCVFVFQRIYALRYILRSYLSLTLSSFSLLRGAARRRVRFSTNLRIALFFFGPLSRSLGLSSVLRGAARLRVHFSTNLRNALFCFGPLSRARFVYV